MRYTYVLRSQQDNRFYTGSAEAEFGLARGLSQRNFRKAEAGMERMAIVGRDSPYARIELGSLAAQSGELARSLHHLEAGVRLYPTVAGGRAWARRSPRRETERARELLQASGSGAETLSSWRLRQRLLAMLES